MDVVDLTVWGVVVPTAAIAIWVFVPSVRIESERAVDRGDLAVVGILWVAVVAAFRLAFVGFTTDRVPGLFLSFAVELVVGVVGPLWWVV